MKYPLVLLLVTLLVSCGGGNEQKEALESVAAYMSTAEERAEQQKKLQELDPLVEEDYSTLFPDQFMGMERTSTNYLPYEKYNYSGYSALYKGNDRRMKITIKDGAKSGIHGTYSGMLQNPMTIRDDERGYEVIEERDGKNVNISFTKDRMLTLFLYAHNNRYIIEADGMGIPVDDAWTNLQKLPFDQLP